MVRQVPLTLMESPRWASVRISGQSEMVREVPLPPDVLGSREAREEIVPRVSTRPVNIVRIGGGGGGEVEVGDDADERNKDC